ncbi:MAG TPA: Npt1/Npt2 family nucleotide transporter [Bryobacteraceae bacterium]|nr:Npt1/Npt2 family nucleotide transporter [Bryobacteraceae bacterium]
MANTAVGISLSPPRRTLLDRCLLLFSEVRDGEGAGVLLLAANVFLLLGTYYILKTIREPLILSQPGGAEMKSYAAVAQTALFLLLLPLYGMIGSRANRMRLIASTMGFFILNLAAFFALGVANFRIGVAFYIWVGVFNMFVVAQFWSFANDLYTDEQGRRLFPIAGMGASLGALLGALLAEWLFGHFSPYQMMAIAALMLVGCLGLTYAAHRRESRRGNPAGARRAIEPLDRKGGFQLIAKERYLLLIAALVLLLNVVNTNGEYMVSRFVSESAQHLPKATQNRFIGQFYGDYFSWVNLLGLVMQTFLVSRLFRWIGIGGALFVLPIISLTGYSMLAFAPALAVIRAAKIFENSTDYSLNNTVRHALFLPTSREAKYKAKAAIDTFFVRGGDVVSAGCVFIGVHWLSLTVPKMALLNVGLVMAWLVLAVLIRRRHAQLTAH